MGNKGSYRDGPEAELAAAKMEAFSLHQKVDHLKDEVERLRHKLKVKQEGESAATSEKRARIRNSKPSSTDNSSQISRRG